MVDMQLSNFAISSAITIIFQCNKLEENGHESILITVGKENHWMTGSEQGLSFLHQKLLLVTEFINFCAGNYLHTVKPVLSSLSKIDKTKILKW